MEQFHVDNPEANLTSLPDTLTVASIAINAASQAYQGPPDSDGASATYASALGLSTTDSRESELPSIFKNPEEATLSSAPEGTGLTQELSPTVDADALADPQMPAPGVIGQFLREQDRLLPVSNVAKIMSRELRHLPHAKISKEAKNFVQECSTEWICFIMSEANDLALEAKRKAVSGMDVIEGCRRLDMKDWVGPLTNALSFLQPPKRQRNKQDVEAAGPARKRRRRVTDEEAEKVRQQRQDATNTKTTCETIHDSPFIQDDDVSDEEDEPLDDL